MSYIFGEVKISEKRAVRSSLAQIHGIGVNRSSYVCDLFGLSQRCKTLQLNRYQFAVIFYILKRWYGTETFLFRLRDNQRKAFLTMSSYKSIKYNAGLPIRGQRTRANAKTAKRVRSSGGKRNRKLVN